MDPIDEIPIETRNSLNAATDPNITNKAHILHLNSNCLLEIFSYLDMHDLVNIVEVSLRFKQNACNAFSRKYKNQYIVTNIHRDSPIDESKISQFRNVLRYFGSEILKLQVCDRKCSQVDYKICNEIIKYCSRTVTDIKFEYVGKKAQKKLCQSFHNLKKIYFLGCRLDKATTQLTWCPKLFQMEFHLVLLNDPKCIQRRFPELQHFTAEYIKSFTNTNMEIFFNSNPQLNRLSLLNCYNIEGNILDSIGSKLIQLEYLHVKFIIQSHVNFRTKSLNLPNLKQLNLVRFEMSSSFLTSLATTSNQLEELILKDCRTDDELIESICKLQKLRKIEIAFHEITDEQLCKIAANLLKLKELVIYDGITSVTLKGIIKFIRLCANLEFLSMYINPDHPTTGLNVNFHEQFLKIVQHREAAVKLILYCWSADTVVEVTKEMITENGCVLCWTGYRPQDCDSATELLDLNDKCMTHLFRYLADDTLFILTDICTRFKINARKAFALQHKSSFFDIHISHVDDETLQYCRDILRKFGDLLPQLTVEGWLNNLAGNELLEIINQFCSQTIIKLRLKFSTENNVSRLCQSFPNLTKLGLERGLHPDSSSFSWCPNLTHLEFCYDFENPDCIGREFPHLQHFSVMFCENFQNKHIEQFIKSNPQLKSIRIRNESNSLSANIVEHMDNTLPQLESLILDSFETIDTALCVNSINLNNLKKLTLFRSKTITSAILASIVTDNNCAQLEELKLCGCKMSDYLIEQICKFKELKTLSVNINGITGENMIELAGNLTKLTNLSIRWSKAFASVHSVIAFAHRCKDLKKLDLDFVGKYSLDFEVDVPYLYADFVRDLKVKLRVKLLVSKNCSHMSNCCDEIQFYITEEVISKNLNARTVENVYKCYDDIWYTHLCD